MHRFCRGGYLLSNESRPSVPSMTTFLLMGKVSVIKVWTVEWSGLVDLKIFLSCFTFSSSISFVWSSGISGMVNHTSSFTGTLAFLGGASDVLIVVSRLLFTVDFCNRFILCLIFCSQEP